MQEQVTGTKKPGPLQDMEVTENLVTTNLHFHINPYVERPLLKYILLSRIRFLTHYVVCKYA